MNKFEPASKKAYGEKIVISIRLEDIVLKRIDELANKIDISRNEFINQCIEYALSNLDAKDVTEKNSNTLSSVS